MIYHLIASLISILILVFNYWIIQNTERKINSYTKIPPFQKIDYTSSYKKNPASSLKNLLDGDLATSWTKEGEGMEWDFDLELRLTHFYKQNRYIKRNLKEIHIYPCGDSPMKNFQYEVFLREGINVDKELRMHDDRTIYAGELGETNDVSVIQLNDFLPTRDLESYDGKQIFILGIKGKFPGGTGCLAEISVIEELGSLRQN